MERESRCIRKVQLGSPVVNMEHEVVLTIALGVFALPPPLAI